MKKTDISQNLAIVKPSFMYVIENMTYDMAQWIQYQGVYAKGARLYFKFKSTSNSLRFDVPAGFNINNIIYSMKGRTHEIAQHFNLLILNANCANKG